MSEEKETTKVRVPIEKIHENSWNPFSMEPELFQALVEHINNEGSKIPIVVRSCNCSKIEGTHFEILDGENRYFAVQDRRVDLHEIPCIIEAKNDVEARLETVNYNLEHEELVPEKFENLLKELHEIGGLSEDEVADKLYVSAVDLKVFRVSEKVPADRPMKIPLSAKLPTFSISARVHSRRDYNLVNSTLA